MDIEYYEIFGNYFLSEFTSYGLDVNSYESTLYDTCTRLADSFLEETSETYNTVEDQKLS